MKYLVKYNITLLFLLLGVLPAVGQVYMTSKAQVHSVSTTGRVDYHDLNYSSSHGNTYGPSSSFHSTSSYVSSRPSYSVSTPSLNVKTSFSTSAAAITGGVTLADDLGLDDEGLSGAHKVPGVPGGKDVYTPIGDIPWVVLVLAAAVFLIVKKRKFD